MLDEIEKKFLPKPETLKYLHEEILNLTPKFISQGYLNTKNNNITITLINKTLTITTPFKSFEYTLNDNEADKLSSLCVSQEGKFEFHTSNTNIARIRIFGDIGLVTFKGEQIGITKPEIEFSIPLIDANELINLCDSSLTKNRYELKAVLIDSPENEAKWEIDVFENLNKGLILVELEMPSEDTLFEKPIWLGQEVSTDIRYANSNLSIKPFTKW